MATVGRVRGRQANRSGARDRGRGKDAVSAGPVAIALARYHRVGLDTACFIYHLSRHPSYAPVTAELFSMIEAGALAAVTSSLALIEILARPKELGNQAAAESYKVVLATFPNLELRRSDIAITEAAADLRVRYRLTTPEAIQLATAVVDGAEAFIGNNEALRAVTEIDIVLLDDLRKASIPSGGRA